jgi:hypothetical protein
MALHKLIKPLKRESGGVVYKVLPIGTELNIDDIEARRLMQKGFIEDPNAPIKKPKNKPKESGDEGELQITNT